MTIRTFTGSTYQAAFLESERELGKRIGYPALVYDAAPEDAPTPDYGSRGEPGTLRRAITDAIDTYIAYECETDAGSERAAELAVEYMFGEYGLQDSGVALADDASDIQAALDRLSRLVDKDAEIASMRRQIERLQGHARYVWSQLRGAYARESAAREALATAEEHIGALLDLPHMPESITTLTDARAWLRRA